MQTTNHPGYTVIAVMENGTRLNWLHTPNKSLATRDAEIALKTLKRAGVFVVYAGVVDNAHPDAGVFFTATPANTL